MHALSTAHQQLGHQNQQENMFVRSLGLIQRTGGEHGATAQEQISSRSPPDPCGSMQSLRSHRNSWASTHQQRTRVRVFTSNKTGSSYTCSVPGWREYRRFPHTRMAGVGNLASVIPSTAPEAGMRSNNGARRPSHCPRRCSFNPTCVSKSMFSNLNINKSTPDKRVT